MAINTSSSEVSVKSRFTEYVDTQERLPYWARSTNPIVRRHDNIIHATPHGRGDFAEEDLCQ